MIALGGAQTRRMSDETPKSHASAGPSETMLGQLACTAAAVPTLPHARHWWTEAIDGRGIALHADIPRTVPNGAAGRATRICGGAALLNLRLAVAGRGRRAVVTLLPDPVDRPRVLAVVRPGAQSSASPDERLLLAALAGGVPPSSGPVRPILPAARHLLRRAAEAEGVWSHQLVRPDERGRVADALPPETGTDAAGAGMLVVIATTHDQPAAQLQAGQAAQRVLLTAAALGVNAAMLAGPAELGPITTATPALRRGTTPQVLLTVGSGAALAASA
jgi:hypothetical protein